MKNFDFIYVYFCKATDSMQYRIPNEYQEVSNTNHFGSVSDSRSRLTAVSHCVASDLKKIKESYASCIVDCWK